MTYLNLVHFKIQLPKENIVQMTPHDSNSDFRGGRRLFYHCPAGPPTPTISTIYDLDVFTLLFVFTVTLLCTVPNFQQESVLKSSLIYLALTVQCK